MRTSKEELGRIHKERCKELKKIRAEMAKELDVDLKQTECSFEGYCSGTCPKCKSEELKLNMAIMKKQMEETDLKRRVTVAGITTMAALSLTGCQELRDELRQQMDGVQTQGIVVVEDWEEYTEAKEETQTCEVESTEADKTLSGEEESSSVFEAEEVEDTLRLFGDFLEIMGNTQE